MSRTITVVGRGEVKVKPDVATTNIGVVGNAFFNKGLSFDPSFEFPKGSGHECLEHADPHVREAAWKALRAITGVDLPPEPDSWATLAG